MAIGHQAGRRVSAILSDMNRPLGKAIGNALEIEEAVATLRGVGPRDLTELCLSLAAHMVYLGGIVGNIEEAQTMVKGLLAGGQGYSKLCELVEAQGGQVEHLDSITELNPAKFQLEVRSDRAGYITGLRTDEIGRIAMRLGAGREKKNQPIDHAVGLILHSKTGDLVEADQVLAVIHANDPLKLENAKRSLPHVFIWGEDRPQAVPIIFKTVND